MAIGRKGQGEGDDNNVAGSIGEVKKQAAYRNREANRRAKLSTANQRATNQDGNKKSR